MNSCCLSRRSFIKSVCLSVMPVKSAFAAEAPSAVEQAIPISPRRPISGLLMKDGNGADVPLEGFKGKVVVLNLWASWCLPCRREMPSLSRLSQKTEGGNIFVLPLAFDRRGADGVRSFYTELGITNLPVLTGDGGNLKNALSISGLPSTVVIDTAGLHAATVIGEAVWDDDATLAWLRRLARK